jgi:hypothetical protein
MAELANNPQAKRSQMNSNASTAQNEASPNRRPAFRVVCAWCEQPLKSAKPATGLTATSHGICAPCARRHFGLDLESLSDDLVSAA